ncbi:MAG TPA: CHAD domain-containing protein, partial [Acidimicrobiales bacterium]|nr:CHAD domain-containing protein [Acidimicrobiales bacterium]
SDRDLHQVRIRAKRLRYAAEAVEPYVGRKARRTAAAAEDLADLLGDINDAANAARRLRELACHPSVTPSVAFVAGRIAGRADARARVARARWRKSAARLASPRRRSWLA